MNKTIKYLLVMTVLLLGVFLSATSAFADVIIPGQTRRGCSVSVRMLRPEYCDKLDREIAAQNLNGHLPYIIGGIIILAIIVSIIVLVRIRRKQNATSSIK